MLCFKNKWCNKINLSAGCFETVVHVHTHNTCIHAHRPTYTHLGGLSCWVFAHISPEVLSSFSPGQLQHTQLKCVLLQETFHKKHAINVPYLCGHRSLHIIFRLPSYTDWLNPPAHPSLPLEGELFRAGPHALPRCRVSTRPKKWEAETTATWLINLSCLNFTEAKSIGSGNFLDKKYRRPEAKL